MKHNIRNFFITTNFVLEMMVLLGSLHQEVVQLQAGKTASVVAGKLLLLVADVVELADGAVGVRHPLRAVSVEERWAHRDRYMEIRNCTHWAEE